MSGQQLEQHPVKPWKGLCCKRCWEARTDKTRCKCRCHGANHQKGLENTGEIPEELISRELSSQKTLVECLNVKA
jgi:hypothetical protein